MYLEEWARVARVATESGPRVAVSKDSEWILLPESVRTATSISQNDLERAEKEDRCLTGPLRYLPPVVPEKIIGVGLNYRSHAEEVGVPLPSHPLLFSKFTTSLIGDRDPICVDATVTQQADWEVELAVVVGRRLRCASKAEAMAAVLGYTVANDVSARDIQFSDVQWTRAKSLDTFCPLGPWLVPAARINCGRLRLRARVNGVPMQDGDTSDMLFDVGSLLSFCSWNFTLNPGDVVLTGTPPGVGAFRTPPIFLEHGDIVDVEIDHIGVLSNPVVVTTHPEDDSRR